MESDSRVRHDTAKCTGTPEAVVKDRRHVYRVATFGLRPRFRRLLDVITRHTDTCEFHFELAEKAGPGEFDIALVDMTASGGAQVARTLRKVPRSMPVIAVGRRESLHPRGRDDLLFDSFSRNALGVLSEAADSLTQRSVRNGWDELDARSLRRLEVSGRAPRVLVVDESHAVRNQVSLALRHLGVDVEGVGSIAQAEDVLFARSYELMILEQSQPDGSGLDLLRRIRHGDSRRRLPIVMLSHRHGVMDLCKGALAGCDGYLAKPVAMGALYATVHRLLRRSLMSRPERLETADASRIAGTLGGSTDGGRADRGPTAQCKVGWDERDRLEAATGTAQGSRVGRDYREDDGVRDTSGQPLRALIR